MYTMSDIEKKLGLDRGGLVALGLLIGCDFVPKGVPGIGVANATRLLQTLHGKDVIARYFRLFYFVIFILHVLQPGRLVIQFEIILTLYARQGTEVVLAYIFAVSICLSVHLSTL